MLQVLSLRSLPEAYDSSRINEIGNGVEKVMVTVATKGGTVEWWLDGHKDEAVWGLDIEWRPTFQKGDYHFASLLQLSLEDCCLLIQLQFIDVLPESLKNLLANSQIMMGGVGIKVRFESLVCLPVENFLCNVNHWEDVNLPGTSYELGNGCGEPCHRL